MINILVMLFIFISIHCSAGADYNPDLPMYNNVSYYQGNNDYGALGSCVPASVANVLNLLSESDNFTENDVINWCLGEKLCEIVPDQYGEKIVTTKTPWIILSMMTEKQDEASPDKYLYTERDITECFYEKTEKCMKKWSEKLADYFEEFTRKYGEQTRAAAIVLVNSGVLFYDDELHYTDDTWNHAIAVAGPVRDNDGKLLGFEIVDSGAHGNYVSAEKMAKMSFSLVGFAVRF